MCPNEQFRRMSEGPHPAGVFSILEKDKNHQSSTDNNATMPNMNRLT